MVAGTIILNTTDNVRLRSYQILDAGDKGSVSDCVSAIYLAVSDGCKVINCSIGYHPSEKPQAMIDAVDYANEQGCVVVVGAGNDSKTLEKSNCYPASISSAITVGSVDEYDSITSFSNFGNGVDVYASGVNIASYNKSGEKAYDSGTSASATIVSAIASLLLSYNENLTTSEIETLLSENGKSVYQSTNLNNNVIADAYEMMKSISGSELEQLELDYDMSFNDSSIYTNISFKSNDENAKIYYRLCKGLYLISPTSESSLYENGTTINLDRYQTICAYAFAPGKAKSKIEYIMAPINYYEEGFLVEPAGDLQQYNTISRCQLKQSVIEIPNEINGYTVEKIGKYCFMGNKDVETIVLPETVVEIDDYAFANCPNLKTVIAPGVDTCGMYVFYDCDSLINVEMPNLTYANTGLFKNCISLEIAKLGTLTEIDNHAFYGCKSLLEINSDIQNEQWAVNTFYNCDSLICPASKHNYKYKSCSNDMVLYECIDCKSTTTRSVEYLQTSWRNSIINQKQNSNLFDSYLQFDVVPDGIINAKDYAKIKSSR